MAKINKDDLKIGVTFTPCSKCERVETVHGEWIFGKNHGEFVEAECSHCKGLLLVKWYDEIGKYRFCPNCGADMRKDGANNV